MTAVLTNQVTIMSNRKRFSPINPSTFIAGQNIVVRLSPKSCTYHDCRALEPHSYTTVFAAVWLQMYLARRRLGLPGNETPIPHYYWMEVQTVTAQHITLRTLIGTDTTDLTRTVVLTNIHNNWIMTTSPES